MNDLHSENINDEILLSTKAAQEKHVFANSKNLYYVNFADAVDTTIYYYYR